MAVITISRLPGAQGDQLAEAVAQRLEYQLIDRRALVRLAAGPGSPEVALERSPELRERSPSFWERLNEERRRYASVLRRTVTQLAEQDNVVIVGLGGGQLLKGLNHVLRVQVIAPTAVRLAYLQEFGVRDAPGPMSRDRARDLLRQRDRESGGYIRYLFNIDWLDPQYWDLVINTGRFSLPQAVHIIEACVESESLQRTPSDEERLHNMVIASRVESQVLGDANVWVSGLKVQVDHGRVHLEGEVITEEDRELVESVVRAIPGVEDVDNDLHVQPPPLSGM